MGDADRRANEDSTVRGEGGERRSRLASRSARVFILINALLIWSSLSKMPATCPSSCARRLWSATVVLTAHPLVASLSSSTARGTGGIWKRHSSRICLHRLHGGSSLPTHLILCRRQLSCRQKGERGISHRRLESAGNGGERTLRNICPEIVSCVEYDCSALRGLCHDGLAGCLRKCRSRESEQRSECGEVCPKRP
jgi:hypothetical protein